MVNDSLIITHATGNGDLLLAVPVEYSQPHLYLQLQKEIDKLPVIREPIGG